MTIVARHDRPLTGVFLTAAIEAMSRNVADPLDVLFEAPGKIRGMDREPLAVALARLNYLLALGDLVQEEHPPFLLPVYLADATRVPASLPAGPDDFMISVSTPAGEFPLPSQVIEDPVMLDWLLGRLTNYMAGAPQRLHIQPEDVAVQEVLNAYYNYLTAAKPRTPVPDALTPAQADILLETARSLATLHIRGEGSLWLSVPGASYSIELYWHPGRKTLDRWKVNLEDPLRRTRFGFDYKDRLLDIVISPDKSEWEWKDEDEVTEAVALGLMSAERARHFYAEGERGLKRLLANEAPFDRDWAAWNPDEAWSMPKFPDGWDVL